MTRAIEYGYKHNMIIKRTYIDNIEFFAGEAMQITDLSKLIISQSKDITTGFVAEIAPFNQLDKLIKASGYKYTAHHYKNQYRSSTNLIEGFNLVILDVDDGVNIETAQMLLKEYTAIFSTTKRHTKEKHRFRVVLPLSHTVKLDSKNYTKFMINVFNWLPFGVDEAAKDSARKWESHDGDYYIQSGELLDAMKFIPNTSAEEKQTKKIMDNSDLSNLERWFFLNIDIGNRSNQLIRYALALVDKGHPVDVIRTILHSFNDRLQYSLSEGEINNTIMTTVINRINKK